MIRRNKFKPPVDTVINNTNLTTSNNHSVNLQIEQTSLHQQNHHRGDQQNLQKGQSIHSIPNSLQCRQQSIRSNPSQQHNQSGLIKEYSYLSSYRNSGCAQTGDTISRYSEPTTRYNIGNNANGYRTIRHYTTLTDGTTIPPTTDLTKNQSNDNSGSYARHRSVLPNQPNTQFARSRQRNHSQVHDSHGGIKETKRYTKYNYSPSQPDNPISNVLPTYSHSKHIVDIGSFSGTSIYNKRLVGVKGIKLQQSNHQRTKSEIKQQQTAQMKQQQIAHIKQQQAAQKQEGAIRRWKKNTPQLYSQVDSYKPQSVGDAREKNIYPMAKDNVLQNQQQRKPIIKPKQCQINLIGSQNTHRMQAQPSNWRKYRQIPSVSLNNSRQEQDKFPWTTTKQQVKQHRPQNSYAPSRTQSPVLERASLKDNNPPSHYIPSYLTQKSKDQPSKRNESIYEEHKVREFEPASYHHESTKQSRPTRESLEAMTQINTKSVFIDSNSGREQRPSDGGYRKATDQSYQGGEYSRKKVQANQNVDSWRNKTQYSQRSPIFGNDLKTFREEPNISYLPLGSSEKYSQRLNRQNKHKQSPQKRHKQPTLQTGTNKQAKLDSFRGGYEKSAHNLSKQLSQYEKKEENSRYTKYNGLQANGHKTNSVSNTTQNSQLKNIKNVTHLSEKMIKQEQYFRSLRNQVERHMQKNGAVLKVPSYGTTFDRKAVNISGDTSIIPLNEWASKQCSQANRCQQKGKDNSLIQNGDNTHQFRKETFSTRLDSYGPLNIRGNYNHVRDSIKQAGLTTKISSGKENTDISSDKTVQAKGLSQGSLHHTPSQRDKYQAVISSLTTSQLPASSVAGLGISQQNNSFNSSILSNQPSSSAQALDKLKLITEFNDKINQRIHAVIKNFEGSKVKTG